VPLAASIGTESMPEFIGIRTAVPQLSRTAPVPANADPGL
jgi:hypothetical protein